MSMDSEGLMAHTRVAERLLPPEIKFDASAGTFSGTVAPHKLVIVKSSVDCCTYSSTADAGGHWTIELGATPRWYTTFHIFAKDPNSGAVSEEVTLTFGGRRAELSDVYASESVAFGIGTRGADVAVYGPQGQLLGRSFVSGKAGVWSVVFGTKLKSGDRICVIATLPNGNTSFPHHTKVEQFSVDERSIGRIAGSGARPSDFVSFYDTARQRQIAETQASDDGTWSHKFNTPIDNGTRIEITLLHADGSTTRGPVFTVTPKPCLPPVVDSIDGAQFGGSALPGLEVEYTQLRDGKTVRTGSVLADSTGLWETDDVNPAALEANDVLVATTQSVDGTEQSDTQATRILGQYCPASPEVTLIDQSHATGVGDPGSYVLVSTAADGLICTTKVHENGLWAAYWAPYVVGPLSTDTLVYFQTSEASVPTDDSPTSDYAVRYANILAPRIATPVFTLYIGTEFSGTEATPQTQVFCYNQTKSNVNLNDKEGDVTAGTWKIVPKPENKVDNFDEIYAKAYDKTGGILGADSNKSTPVYSDDFDPPKPDPLVKHTTEVSGTEPLDPSDATAQGPVITIYLAKATDATRTPIGSSRLTLPGLTWSMDFTSSPLTVNDYYVAWAQTDAGKKSEGVIVQIVASKRPRPPVIGDWNAQKVSGNGANGTTVELFLNNNSVGTSAVITNVYWEVDAGRVPINGDSLKAQATDVTNGLVSDPFYILKGSSSTQLSITTMSRLEATVKVDDPNQTILGWRNSDGKKVIDHDLTAAGESAVPYLAGSDIKDDDLISVSSQNTNPQGNGSMTDYDTKYVPYP